MPTQKNIISVFVDTGLFDDIKEYQCREHFRSLSLAVLNIIKLAFSSGRQGKLKKSQLSCFGSSDMAKNKQISIVFDDSVLMQIDDYRFKNRFRSRSSAIFDLIHFGLSVYNQSTVESLEGQNLEHIEDTDLEEKQNYSSAHLDSYLPDFVFAPPKTKHPGSKKKKKRKRK